MTYDMAAEEDEGPRRIEPTNFDLIVVGAGLPESIIAAAAASAGKTVLQINPDHYYHSPFASLPPKDLVSFLHLHSTTTTTSDPCNNTGFRAVNSPAVQANDSSFNILPLGTRPLYSSVEVYVYSPEKVLEDSLQTEFNLDLAGPRVLFCADPMMDLIVDVDVQNCMSFKSLDTSYCIHDKCQEGKSGGFLWNSVPDSRNAIFRDRGLSFKEKNQLLRFFKLFQAYYRSNFKSSTTTNNEEEDENNGVKITQEDLETPFVEFLTRKIGLSPKLTAIILYTMVMADYEQDNMEVCKKDIVKTKVGIDRLMLYHRSVGRFHGATGPMLYPIYGQGELAHFFCRRAAIMGGVSITQMPVAGLLVDKDVGNYKGVKLVTGQELFSHQLILGPTFVIPPGLTPSPSVSSQDGYNDFGLRDDREKVIRGICITDNSFKADVANCLVFYSPKSLCPDQMTSVRICQLSSNVQACPSGMFVVYISTICGDVVQGKRSVNAAIEALFSTPVSGNSEDNSRDPLSENTVAKVKPTVLWSTLYIQELIMGGFGSISSTPMPDGNLQYNDVVDAALKLFQEMYPDEEFFPKKIPWLD